MKKAGFVVVIGILVASLLLINIALAPQVAASSEKTATKPANDVVGMFCPKRLHYCCFTENGRPMCGCYALCPS